MSIATLAPEATYDCLYIASRLDRRLLQFSRSEIQLLAYLACLLSLYQKSPIADWGYAFVGTSIGAPFSREIDLSIEALASAGLFESKDDSLHMSSAAEEHLVQLSQQRFFESRSNFLNGACASILALSIGLVREALSQEPELSRAKELNSSRRLLEGPGLTLLYEQFDVLSSVFLDNRSDLRIPAVAWLTALAESAPRGKADD